MYRLYTATICTASTMDGSTRCRIRSIRWKPMFPGVVIPATGNSGWLRWSHLVRQIPNRICSITANQKFGMESATKAPLVDRLSKSEYCRMAE